jgi:hypothetical protein
MRTLTVSFVAAFILAAHCALAQPMSGNYTVGGTSPTFATLQELLPSLGRRLQHCLMNGAPPERIPCNGTVATCAGDRQVAECISTD